MSRNSLQKSSRASGTIAYVQCLGARHGDDGATRAGSMMFEGLYRQRLEADLARWESQRVIAPAVGESIRAALPQRPKGVNVATVVAIVGGLLIAGAFLAFVASNWTAI